MMNDNILILYCCCNVILNEMNSIVTVRFNMHIFSAYVQQLCHCLSPHTQVLHEAKNAAHLMKFGEEIPPFN